MHHAVVPVWKPQGWTPFQAVEVFENKHPQYKDESVSYAGRLDPMAEGVLILLVGNENKHRKKYEQLEKIYEAEMVFGISTDSLDALGLITKNDLKNITSAEIQSVLPEFVRKQSQIYPVFSSKTVGGKPLYWWARRNRLSEITIPHHDIEVFSLELTSTNTLTFKHVYEIAKEKIGRVTGDFRQEKILDTWEQFSRRHGSRRVTVASIRVSCTSGTYIRQLVSDIGDRIGCGAFALSIKRTQIGNYTKRDTSVASSNVE